ncbi:MAG: NAD(P)/FAD-dependent oxidoreductase [Enterobacterales bacterium]|nr:NAD(P)/FAD-dependent oxidoreductase [Enterobacterales bacterium]
MSNNKNTQSITLVGAGLVGSLLSLYLAKRGYQVEVYEHRDDMRRSDISAGRSINLALANRGIYPLQKAGLMEQINPLLIAMKGRMIHDLDGNTQFQSYSQREEEVIYSVSRGDLNKICMTAAEATGKVNIHFGKKCQVLDLNKCEITLRDQQTQQTECVNFDHIIGTDGGGSIVRQSIHEKKSTQHKILPLGHQYKELTIPAGDNGSFLIDKHSLHIWPRGGFMLIALPNLDGSFTVTLFMPESGEVSFEAFDNQQKLMTFFNQYFKDILPLIPDLATEYFSNPTGHLATVKCAPWYFEDKALLLGDAAHAVVPFHGQGMNCGFEDVSAFAQCHDRLKPNSASDWQTLFAEVDAERKDNADAIADMAIENYITMRDSVNDQKFLLRRALGFALEKKLPNYFCPRYSMVMFHRLGYAEAKQRGKIQESILFELTQGIDDITQVDYALAEKLLVKRLKPLVLNP